MKTLNHFLNFKYKPLQCYDGLLRLPFWPQAGWHQQTMERLRENAKPTLNDSKGRKLTRLILRKMIALADRVAAVNRVKPLIKSFPRFAVGLVMLVWVAPYADMFYTRFDINDRVSPDVWYYESWNWFFLCLGPYLKNFFTALGLYLCFMRGPVVILLLAYTMMYDVGKILWLIQVDNHAEYNSLPTTLFYTYGFITAVFLLAIADGLTYWLNHRVEAIKRRLHGLKNIADLVSPEVFKSKVVETIEADIKIQQFKQY